MIAYNGSEHIIPLLPCPLCGGEVQFLEDQDEMVWFAECKECELTLGRSNG